MPPAIQRFINNRLKPTGASLRSIRTAASSEMRLSQLRNRPADVLVPTDSAQQNVNHIGGFPNLTNVRNFSGPDYARVVIDLSEQARYNEHRTGNKLIIQLNSTAVSPSLNGRRFIV